MNRTTVNPLKIAALGLLAALAFAIAPAASAHTSLISEAPADGDVVTELADVRLEFSEELLDLGNSVTLTDAEGTTVDLETDLSEPRVLTAPLPVGLTAGDYEIDWRVVANDGHPLEDTIGFTYAPAAASSSATASAAPSEPKSTPSAAAATPQASASASPEASVVPIGAPVETDTGSSSSLVWWIIGVGLLVGIGVGYVMWRRASKPAAEQESQPESPTSDAPQS